MKMKYWGIAALLAGGMMFAACSDDETIETGGDDTPDTEEEVSAYVVASTVQSAGQQAAVVLATETLDEGTITALGSGYETDYANAATWLFYRDRFLYRLSYAMGQDGTTVAFYLDKNGEVKKRAKEYTISNFTAYGVCGNKVITSATGVTDKTDEHGNKAYGITFSLIDVDAETVGTKTIASEDFLGNGEYVMLAGLLEANGKIYAGVVPLGVTPYGHAAGAVLPENEDLVKLEDGGTGGGMYTAGTLDGTQYPNNCYVAIFDNDSFDSYTIVKTDKMSWAAGRMRSAYYQTVWAADNGDIYVFSPSYAKLQSDPRQRTTHPSSVMRIKKGATEFDSTYEPFNIEAAAEAAEGGATTRARGDGGSGSGSGSHGGGSTVTDNSKAVYRCWHITADYFLLQMYTQGINAMGTATTKMAIFKGEDRTFKYVTGLPESDVVSSFSVKNPYSEDGYCYVGVTTTDGAQPAIYKIDAATATAVKGLTVISNETGAIGKLVAEN